MWEIIGWIGSGIVVVSMLQQRITRLRLINLVGCLVSLAYSIAISAWPMAGLNTVLALIQVYHLLKLWRTRHDPTSYHVVAAQPDSELIAHLLERHSADIARFFPHFGQPTNSTHAFVVFAGDTVAGFMIATKQDNIAHLDVDFVIPKYRDFTPGEFVFSRSVALRDMGVDTVVSPLDGPDYYQHLDFKKQADGRYIARLEATI